MRNQATVLPHNLANALFPAGWTPLELIVKSQKHQCNDSIVLLSPGYTEAT